MSSARIRKCMTMALDAAEEALRQDEVPVGCVIVYKGSDQLSEQCKDQRRAVAFVAHDDDGQEIQVAAMGKNMTNETRNATRHAEMVAIDDIIARHSVLHPDASLRTESSGNVEIHSSNVDWSSMELYVSCEPCIMCAAALSMLQLKTIYFGCNNDKFGGCGSILDLNEPTQDASRNDQALHVEKSGGCNGVVGTFLNARGGYFKDRAISLLQQFYKRGNPRAPKPHRPVLQDRG